MFGLEVKTCLSCFSLRSGTIAIGVFYLVTGIFGASICVVFLLIPTNIELEETDTGRGDTLKIFLIIGGTMSTIQALVSAFLIYGGYMKNTCCLIPWMVYAVTGCILVKLSVIFIVFKVVLREKVAIGGVILLAVKALLFAHFLVVVSSYRKSVQEENSVLTKVEAGTIIKTKFSI